LRNGLQRAEASSSGATRTGSLPVQCYSTGRLRICQEVFFSVFVGDTRRHFVDMICPVSVVSGLNVHLAGPMWIPQVILWEARTAGGAATRPIPPPSPAVRRKPPELVATRPG